MSKAKEKVPLVLNPNLVKFAETDPQRTMLENLEVCIEFTDHFLKSNKKADFEKAVNRLNLTLAMINKLTKDEGMKVTNAGMYRNGAILLDVVHDALLLPAYILQYTANKNKSNKRIG